MKTDQEVGKAAYKRSGAVDHAMRLLTMQFFSHIHTLLGKHSLYTFDDYKHLKRNAVKQVKVVAPGILLYFALIFREEVELLHIEQSAEERPNFIELHYKGTSVRSSAASADAELFVNYHRQLVYRAEAPRLGYVPSFSVKKKRTPSSIFKTGR